MKCLNTMLLLCLLAAGSIARAGTCTTIIPQLSTLSVGTINVQRDAPVGTVVFSGAASATGSYLTGCTNPLMLGFSMRYNSATLSSYGNHVYNTNVSGIGIRFSSNGYFENPSNTFSYNAQTSYVDWYGGRIELVVTGPVSSGALTPGVIGVVTLQGSDGLYRDGLTTQLTSGNINAPGVHGEYGPADVSDRGYSRFGVRHRGGHHASESTEHAKPGLNLRRRNQYYGLAQWNTESGQRQYQRDGLNRAGKCRHCKRGGGAANL